MEKLSLSKPMSPSEIEEIYYKIVRTQEFYDEDYSTEWKKDGTPQKTIAKMAINYFKPAKVIDIGCGLGYVVKHLRRDGVEANGIDYSQSFINSAPLKLRKYLSVGDIANIDFNDNSFDLVICMEVLEHLPLKLVDIAIDELKRICTGSIFVTIPSYGPNGYGPYGLPLNENTWFEDAKRNISFSQIVVDGNGIPDCGHITLATYKWWTEKFLQHNLIRDGRLELMINNDQELNLRRWNWNIYVLHEITSDDIFANSKQFGVGWHQIEDWGETRGEIRWTKKDSIAYLMPKGHETKIKFEVYSGPRELIYNRTGEIVIEQYDGSTTFIAGRKEISIPVNEWSTIEISLVEPLVKKQLCVKILLDSIFNPKQIFDSLDNRELGIAIKRIYLE